MLRKVRNTAIVSLLLLFAACGSSTVVNYSNEAHSAAQGTSSKQIGDAIRRAGAGRGWVMKRRGPGKIEATLNIRVHTAVVEVSYNKKTFSINYKDSDNLSYDNGSIHRNYNSWVKNLRQAILAQISAI